MDIKLFISVPSCRDWKPRFGSSLVALTRHLDTKGIKGHNLTAWDFGFLHGASVLPRARNISVDIARKANATHLLCIDDDMQFPGDIIDGMSCDEDIVACNYLSKVTGKCVVHDLNGNLLDSSGKTGLEEVGWVGFGFVLIKLDAIKDIPQPLFEVRWIEEKQDLVGEDFYFCGKVRAHGTKIYCDHDASQKIAHIGDHAYRIPFKPQIISEVA